MKNKETKTKKCQYCKMDIPYTATVCPYCQKKQPPLKRLIIVLVILFVIYMFILYIIKDSESSTPQTASGQSSTSSVASSEEQEIEYIPVTADELLDALSANALKAQNDYKGQYLEISGILGTIDSDGKYIDVTTESFNITPIQCYIKTDEQKQIIMNMSAGDDITVKGYCKSVGEVLGYSINIDSIE